MLPPGWVHPPIAVAERRRGWSGGQADLNRGIEPCQRGIESGTFVHCNIGHQKELPNCSAGDFV
jgi:hypothetical protein